MWGRIKENGMGADSSLAGVCGAREAGAEGRALRWQQRPAQGWGAGGRAGPHQESPWLCQTPSIPARLPCSDSSRKPVASPKWSLTESLMKGLWKCGQRVETAEPGSQQG